jgi:Putative zinc-finger
MVVNCEEVWREISNYLEGEIDPTLRVAIEEHARGCKRCTAVLDGTRNVIELYGDERMVEVPLGFSYRLQRRLEDNMPNSRRSFFGWMVAAAAGILIAGGFEVARSSVFSRPQPRSEHAQSVSGVPPDLMVVVYPEGKTFHFPTCTFIPDKKNLRTIAARDAEQQGYVPCTRCMKKYLTTRLGGTAGTDGAEPALSS